MKKRIAIIIVGLLIIGITSLTVIPHMIISEMIDLHVEHATVYKASEYNLVSEYLELETKDNIQIGAYLVKAEDPKGSIIFLSGIHNPSITAFYGHAKMVTEWGYDAYLLEVRAHGASQGNLVSLGYKEVLDVDVLVDQILSSEKKDAPIIVYGVSMGGAIAINSIGLNDNIDAVISFSAYSSFTDNFIENMLMMGMPKIYTSIQKPFISLYTSIRFGFDTRGIYPKNMIRYLDDRPALLIHSSEDDQVPIGNLERIRANASENVEHIIKEGNYHMILEGDDFLYPWQDEEYESLIKEFLDRIE
jgi:hypothetical protein